MSIKQQKDIRIFLEGEYTFDTAEQIYKKQEESLISKKHASTATMEIIPGFFYIYRAVFLKIMRTTELQLSDSGSSHCLGGFKILTSKEH